MMVRFNDQLGLFQRGSSGGPGIGDRAHFSVLVILVGLLLAGCEETVNPVLESAQPFSLYGYIDPTTDRQAIRVYPIVGVLERTRPEPLAAEVELSGPGAVTSAFRDSIVQFVDGSYGHVYYGFPSVDFDALYTLRARDIDGREARVNLRTPKETLVAIGEASAVLGNVRMPVSFQGAEQIRSPRAVYTIEVDVAPFEWIIPIAYDDKGVRDGETWTLTVDISRDIGVLYMLTGLRPGFDDLTLLDLTVEAFVTTSDWTSPTGSFDAEILVQPGTFSNVQNGFGFVGAGYRASAATLPPASILRLAGFANGE